MTSFARLADVVRNTLTALAECKGEIMSYLKLVDGELKVGDKVGTIVGDRIKGPFGVAKIESFCKWAQWDAVMIRKSNGRLVRALLKNLYKVAR